MTFFYLGYSPKNFAPIAAPLPEVAEIMRLADEYGSERQNDGAYEAEGPDTFKARAALEAKVNAMAAALVEAQKDAERYRWLAADGDRARELLNRPGLMYVQATIDAAIARGAKL